MKKIKNNTTLINKYSLMYKKKPKSRVFAPLAEAYRKLGMLDEAMKILAKGIKNHPSYTLGYTVLASCYFDQKNYEMAYNTVRPFVSQNLENLTLQKLFANTCIQLGHLEEALQTFKYLLLLNPKDSYVAEQIKLLEDDLMLAVDEKVETQVKNNESSFDEDEWVQVNFNRAEEHVSDEDDWELQKSSPLESFKDEVKNKSIEVKEHHLNDDYYHEDFDNQSEDVIAPDYQGQDPIISHTLVDLYCEQGHLDKAASVLENILELHPDDQPTRDRLDEITMKLVKENMVSEPEILSENKNDDKAQELRRVLDRFQTKIVDLSHKKLASL